MQNHNDLRALYGTDYVNKFIESQSTYRLINLLKHIQLKKTDKIVDFGCGSGMILPFINYKILKYVGVDFSEKFIEAANEAKRKYKIENADFFCSDIDKFSQNFAHSFDIGLAMDFAEHVYDQEWLSILTAMKYCISKNGRIFLHTPNASFFVEILKKHNIFLKQFSEHIAVRTVSEHRLLFDKAGFEIVKVVMLPHYNVLKYFHLFSFLPLIGKFFEARIFFELKPIN